MEGRVYPVVADAPAPELRWQDAFPLLSEDKLPATVDMSGFLSPVRDQGSEGSCTAASGCTCVEYLYRRFRGETVILSPAFLYQMERQIMGTLYQDSGARLRVTQQVLLTTGVCPEKDDPYTPADFVRGITPQMLQDAARYRIAHGYWAPSLQEILNALAHGLVVQLAIMVYPSFESPAVASSGAVPMPAAGEQPLGGHAVCAYGYDLQHRQLFVRNSWGPTWGRQGNFTLPFGYIQGGPAYFLSARVYTLDPVPTLRLPTFYHRMLTYNPTEANTLWTYRLNPTYTTG